MRTQIKKALTKIAFIGLIISFIGIVFSCINSTKVKATQDPVFTMIDGAYIHEVEGNYSDKTAIRFYTYVTESWVEQNLTGLPGIDYEFFTEVSGNGKTKIKTWTPKFDEDGEYYRSINLANFPSEEEVPGVYSHEFTVRVGVATVQDIDDGYIDNPIIKLDGVTRTMEYVAAKASANGENNVSIYLGGGNALVNDEENVVEIGPLNKTPNRLIAFEGYNGAKIESVYVNEVKQANTSDFEGVEGGLMFNADALPTGKHYSIVAITEDGNALVANDVMPVDFAISDVASYLEWYNAIDDTNYSSTYYYSVLTDDVYLTKNEVIPKAPTKSLANGVLDGRGHILDGITHKYNGAWRNIGDFTFKNIALTNVHHDASQGCSYSALFSYNDAVALNFDNVWLSYLNETSRGANYVGFTSLDSNSTDENVHFYNSVIVSDMPNTSSRVYMFKKGAVGTLSNTKIIQLNNRKVVSGVSADYTSLDAYYADTTMSTSGYNMDVWTVVNGVLRFKRLSLNIELEAETLGQNLLQDSVEITLSTDHTIKSVEIDGESAEYTFNNGVLTVLGFSSVDEYTLRVKAEFEGDVYTYTKAVSVVANKTAADADYNGYIVLDGVSKHTLVIPSSTDTYSSQAISHFTSLFAEATGITLLTETDSSTISYTESSRYIVLGGSYIYSKAGLSVDPSVEQDGYQILTKGQSIFILGTTTRGKLFGAYELLAKLFNYERFSPETYTIDKGVEFVELPYFDFIDNPDAELRIGGWGSVYYDSKESAALTMRFDMNYKDLWVEDTVYGANWTHNIAEIMDYVGHIPTDKSKIVDNFGNKFDVDTTVSGWYNNYTMTYSYKDPLNKTGTRYDYDVNRDYRKSYGFKVGWFSVAATSDTMKSYGDPLACTSNNDPVVNKAVQLCYSGGTYPTDTKHEVWQEMVEFGAQRVADIINAYTGKNKIFQITAEDNAQYCQCKACRAWYDYYSKGNLYLHEYINTSKIVMSKGLMGLQLRFVNALANYITKHNLLDEDKKDVKIACFCYSNYTDSPCIEQADGTFKPIDDAVVCPDNVLIYYAPSMDYTKELNDPTSETNTKMLKILKANSVLCNHIGAWLYQMSDYDDYFLPSNNYYAYSDLYQTLIDMGAKWIFHQGAQKSTTRNTAFAQLKLYLNSKLQWDTSLDTQKLINNFFDGYYGPASATMKEFFYRVYDVADANGGKTTLSKNVFSQEELEYWIELCEQALVDIASLKNTDSARYNLLVKNINCEMMMPRYLLIRLYSTYKGSSITNLTTVRNQFIAECKAAGVLTGNGQTSIDSVVVDPV